jgi:hypothetical protein
MAISRRIINFFLFLFQLRAGDGVDNGLVQIQTVQNSQCVRSERKTTKGSETGSHVSPVSVKVTRTFNIFESISESISDSTVFEDEKTARYNQAHVAMKFTENLSTGIMGKTLRAEHAPNIVLDPNEVFRKKPKPLDKGVSDDD